MQRGRMSLVVAVLVFTMMQSEYQERNESIRLMNAAVKLANEGRTEEAISRLSDAALVDPTNLRPIQ